MSQQKDQRQEAVALSFNPSQLDAPRVIAKGKGKVADSILEQAKLHDIPIQEDPNLVQMLGQLDLNEAIPEELYQAVAEVFAFIYRLDRTFEEIQNKRS